MSPCCAPPDGAGFPDLKREGFDFALTLNAFLPTYDLGVSEVKIPKNLLFNRFAFFVCVSLR
jgi:hypothetical protein